MDFGELLKSAKLLAPSEQAKLISELLGQPKTDCLSIRKEQFFNKQANCPHCSARKYIKYGKDKGSQRFMCKACHQTFTEYTGTWLDGLQKKSRVSEYIELMMAGKSLDKISAQMGINKKTAFDWRHKILSSLTHDEGKEMEGIVESDETFFEESCKGSQIMNREGRKRGNKWLGKGKRGVLDNKVAVIVTADRKGSLNLCAATMGRIGKADILRSIQSPLPEQSILCTDGHNSYKGFAMDSNLKHITLRGDMKQHVKQGVYHIQNVNSLHNRLKKWIDYTFWGVSTKYLQNYLGWFRINEKLKNSSNGQRDFINETLQDDHALKRYSYINFSYRQLLTTQV